MYLDLVILVNLGMNFFILWMVSLITFRSTSFKKIVVGAGIGALLSVVVVSINLYSWWRWFLLLSTPVLMVYLVFYPIKIKELPALLGTFFGVAFLTGGTIIALPALFDKTDQAFAPSGWWLFGGCLFLLALVRYLRPYFQEKQWQNTLEARVEVKRGEFTFILSALLDTGNQLKDPFTQKPVILMDHRYIKEMLPGQLCEILANGKAEPWEAMQAVASHPDASRLFLIPFSGVGGSREMLLGYRPDGVTFLWNKERHEIGEKVVIGLHGHSFGTSGDFQALLPPEVINQS